MKKLCSSALVFLLLVSVFTQDNASGSQIFEKSLPRLGFPHQLHRNRGDIPKGWAKSRRRSIGAGRLWTISGNVPEPLHFPRGCKFHPRCPRGKTDKRCRTVEPELREVQPGRCVACWHIDY